MNFIIKRLNKVIKRNKESCIVQIGNLLSQLSGKWTETFSFKYRGRILTHHQVFGTKYSKRSFRLDFVFAKLEVLFEKKRLKFLYVQQAFFFDTVFPIMFARFGVDFIQRVDVKSTSIRYVSEFRPRPKILWQLAKRLAKFMKECNVFEFDITEIKLKMTMWYIGRIQEREIL